MSPNRGGKRHEVNYIKGAWKSICLVSDKEKNVKSRWKGKKKTLYLIRKMIINTEDFMSGKKMQEGR